MREIKFRYRLRVLNTGELLPMFIKDISEIEEGVIKSIANGEVEILSRDAFTGEIDKLGKEIYECDIIKFVMRFPVETIFISPNSETSIKSLKDAEAIWVGKIENFGSHFFVSGEMGGIGLDRAKIDCEVIGNIYDHIHLMKKENINY